MNRVFGVRLVTVTRVDSEVLVLRPDLFPFAFRSFDFSFLRAEREPGCAGPRGPGDGNLMRDGRRFSYVTWLVIGFRGNQGVTSVRNSRG